jgi:signal transduction histidine kinase
MTLDPALLELSRVALGTMRSGVIVSLNAAGRAFGLVEGQQLLDIVAPECRAELQDKLAVEGTREIAVRTYGINVKWLSFRFVGKQDIHFVATDVTPLVEYQRLMADHLVEVERAGKELAQFAYAASHDIQEPLRTITNYVAFLLEDYSAALPAEAQEYLTNVGDAAKHCRELVRALMGYSTLGRDARFFQVNCEDELRKVLAALELAIKDSGATITCGPLPDIFGDAALFRATMTNLISNALKFGVPGRAPTIKLGAGQVDGKWLFWVQDDGIGIDPKHATQIFDVFKRLDKTKPGVGIGLASARKAVSIHQGELWVESQLGAGSTFYFTVERPHDGAIVIGGRSPAGRIGDEASASSFRDAAQAIRSGPWRNCDAILAWKGSLSRREPSGSDLARSKPA